MFKKYALFLFIVIFFLSSKFVYAEVVINEVQIAGSTANDEFIELYNSGDGAVSLTGFYIKKKTSTGSESNFVVASRFESVNIASGGYLLLARENEYTGTVVADVFWPSSYSLANNNSLTLYRGNDTDKNEVNWQTIEESKSFQRTETNSWIGAAPTPGAVNQTSNSNNDTGNDTDDSSGNGDNTNEGGSGSGTASTGGGGTNSPLQKTEAPKTKVKILAKSVAFTGIPFSLQAQVSGLNNASLYGKFFWNFGDGDSIEMKGGEPFSHIYLYAGDYTVSLEYYTSYYSNIPDATAKMVIKAVPMDISISKVGDANDFFVELSNNTSYEIDISKWILSASDVYFDKKFTLPKNTIILAKKKIILSPKITNLIFEDAANLKLKTAEGQIVFDYGASLLPVLNPILPPKIIEPEPEKEKEISAQEDVVKEIKNNVKNETQVVGEDLSASVIVSSSNEEMGADGGGGYVPMLASIAFIGASAGAVYFIRQRKIIPKLGDDFKILDE